MYKYPVVTSKEPSIPKTRFSDERLQLLVILIAGIVIRLLVLFDVSAIEIDGISYATIADQFSKGLFAEGLTNIFSPAYPAFVALFHLLIPDVELSGRLVSLVCGTLLIYVCFLFARRFFGDARKAMWVAFLIAFQPYLARYSALVLSESFTVLVFTLSVFAFYTGWKENRRIMFALSGTCLLLAYLARPEYIVYFAPFVLLLSVRRRAADISVFLLPLCIVGVAYVLYLHSQTGLWIVSKKATLSPVTPFLSFFTNFPLVVYSFGGAIFPPFILLAGLGFLRVEKGFRNLVILLILFHIFSLSFVGHSTKRYSVEFIPVCMFFAAEGVSALPGLARWFSRKRVGAFLVVVIVAASGLLESHIPARPDRRLQKEAGRYLHATDPGSVIAARLPIVAFYGQGRWIGLRQQPNENGVAWVDRIISQNQVKYLATDEEIEEQAPAVKQYASRMPLLKEFRDQDCFVRIYRVDSRAE